MHFFFRKDFVVRCVALGLLFVALLAVSAVDVQATSFVSKPFDQFVSVTDIILRGKIQAIRSDWGNGGKQVFTYLDLAVIEVFKGKPPIAPTIVVRQMGGQKEGHSMQIAGAAAFTLGEDVVLFLMPKNIEGTYEIRSLSMGKFKLKALANGDQALTGGSIGLENNGSPYIQKKVWTLSLLRRLVTTQAQDELRNSKDSSPGSQGSQKSQISAEQAPEPLDSSTIDPSLSPVPSPASEAPSRDGSGGLRWGFVLVFSLFVALALVLWNRKG